MILSIYLMDLILLLIFKIALNLLSKSMKLLLKIHKYIQVYPNKIKNRITFKIKTDYKLELLTPERMKLLGSTKKVVDKDKNGNC